MSDIMPHAKESQKSRKNTPCVTGNDTDRKHTLYAINFGTEQITFKHRQKDFAFTQRTVSYIDHLIDVVVFIAIAHAQAEEQHRLRPNCRP